MDPRAAEARGRAYALLAQLVERGVTARTRDAARTSPLLAEAVAEAAGDDLEGLDDLDRLAADHQHAFAFAVHPYEGALLDPEGALAGPVGHRLRATYERLGFLPDPRGPDPEHLATELRALAFLAGAEQDAAEDGALEAHAHVRALTRTFLDAHLLRWFFPLAAALRDLERPLPSALATQIGELLALHRAELGAPAPPAWSLPEGALDLGEETTGLREIAAYLAAPARSGVVLSRDDLAHLGRRGRLPRGFAGREQTLLNLLRAAVRFEALGDLLEDLEALLTRRRAALAEVAPAGILAPLLAPWQARLHETVGLLRAVERAVADDGG